MGRLRVADGRDDVQIWWKVAANILNKHRLELTNDRPPTCRVGRESTPPECNKPACNEMLHRASDLAGSYEHGNEILGSIKGGEILD